jgi:hypothetical protein
LAVRLRPFATRNNPPSLRFHFFANTFPLAYHYWWALKQAGKDDPGHFISFASGFAPPAASEWGYTTRSFAESTNRPFVPVTRFQPKWVFAERSIWTREIYQSVVPNPPPQGTVSLGRFLKAVLNDAPNLDLVTVYAEIPNLGRYVQRCVDGALPGCDVKIFCLADGPGEFCMPPVPIFQQRQCRTVLRLFVYGGPLSSYLRRKSNRYLPLDVDDDAVGTDGEGMETVLVHDRDVDAEEMQQLVEYHRTLVQERHDTPRECPPFFSIYRAFNELAWLVQSRASFQDAGEYHDCILMHHASPKPNSEQPLATTKQ